MESSAYALFLMNCNLGEAICQIEGNLPTKFLSMKQYLETVVVRNLQERLMILPSPTEAEIKAEQKKEIKRKQ